MARKTRTGPNADTGTREDRLAEERLLLRTQVAIQSVLDGKGMRYRDLATCLNVSEARVSQIMGDQAANLTVRTVARIFQRLGEVAVFMTERELQEKLAEACAGPVSSDRGWVFVGEQYDDAGWFNVGLDVDVVAGPEPSRRAERPTSLAAWAAVEMQAGKAASAA